MKDFFNKRMIALVLVFLFQIVYLISGVEIPEDAAEAIVALDWSVPYTAALTAIGIIISAFLKSKDDSSEERK